MIRLARHLCIASLLLLAVLQAEALLESSLDSAAALPRFWSLYLVAHAFCYALVVAGDTDVSLPNRLWNAMTFAAVAFAGSMIAGIVMAVVTWLTFGPYLAVWPATILVLPLMLVVGASGTGAGYGLCLGFAQPVWFGHVVLDAMLKLVHAVWGTLAGFIAASAIGWAFLQTIQRPIEGIPLDPYQIATVIVWFVSLPHLVLAAWVGSRNLSNQHGPTSDAITRRSRPAG